MNNIILELLQKQYKAYTGHAPEQIEELPPSGSHRHYFRLKGPVSLIGVRGDSTEENRAFIYMSEYFSRKGLPVPRVLSRSADDSLYLQEDLGNISLFNIIERCHQTGTFGKEDKELLRQTIHYLPDFQFAGTEGMDFSFCYPYPEFDSRSIFWDLNYFKYCFLKATGLSLQENDLENDFHHMADILLQDNSATFMYRDFQSRNVMIKDQKPWFIDFQGGRKGPIYYDVASFLWQAKANFSDSLRQELLDEYITALQKYLPVDKMHFCNRLRHFVLFRTLQVLGCYGFRGYFEKKPHFIQSIPYAIENLRRLLQTPCPEYPYLYQVLRQLAELKQFSAPLPSPLLSQQRLCVRVTSFSYKKGIPDDPTGNGGGFVFDCRAINNPGRYDRYKTFSGLDEPVIRFLEEDGEIITFLAYAYELVDASVRRYLERGFTSLSVSFGCTGGQHRSVYAAQHMAEHLHKTFGIQVNLTHREQHIEQTFYAKY